MPNATAASMPPAGTPSQLLALEVFVPGVGYFRTSSSNLMKNFVKFNVVPGNLTLDQYSGFRTITLCPATQTNPPCSSLRATLTQLPAKGSIFQPIMAAGALSDKRGILITSVDSIILPSVTATGPVIVVQYLPQDVRARPISGSIWDTLEYELDICSAKDKCTHALRMYTLEEMLMPDEIPFGNFNSISPRSHIFLNPQNHFPIIGLAGSALLAHSVLSPLSSGDSNVFRNGALIRRLQRLPPHSS